MCAGEAGTARVVYKDPGAPRAFHRRIECRPDQRVEGARSRSTLRRAHHRDSRSGGVNLKYRCRVLVFRRGPVIRKKGVQRFGQ